MIAGVCGGLGRYFNVNPALYRVGFVILTFLGGAGILIYAACVLVVPVEGERESIASDTLRNHRQRPLALIGLILVAAGGIALLSHISFRFHSDTFWVLAFVAGVVLLWMQRRPRADASTAAPENVAPPAPPTASSRRRRMFLFLSLGAFGTVLLAAATVAVIVGTLYAHFSHGVGGRSYEPVGIASVRDSYRVGVGTLDLDLSRVRFPAGTTNVRAEAGIGHVHVIVPRGVTVRAKAHVDWGDASLLGHEEDGHSVRSDVGPSNATLVLDTHVGIGQVEVDRTVR
jgi:phage shock protein PspC (stress-responsive transcriptional regulator)